jgi:hypothetical protein
MARFRTQIDNAMQATTDEEVVQCLQACPQAIHEEHHVQDEESNDRRYQPWVAYWIQNRALVFPASMPPNPCTTALPND